LEQRIWTIEEINFLESVAKQVSLALLKIRLLAERKRAEDSEEKYRNDLVLLQSILESPIDIITFALDKNYCYTAYTRPHKDTIKKIWGVDIQIGTNLLNIISIPEDGQKAKVNFDRAFNGESFILTEEYGDRELYRTFYENYYCSIKNSVGEIVGVSVFDVTNRKQVELELEESEKRLRETQKLAHIGVWDWDTDNDIVTWSEELFNIAGLDPMLPAPTYKEHVDLYTPASWELLKNAVEKAINTGESYQVELEFIQPNSNSRYVNAFGGAKYDSKGRFIGLFGTVQDITDTRKAEQVLKDSEEKYRLLSENVSDGVSLFEDNKVKYVSDGYLRMFGFDKQEVENISFQDIFSFIHSDDKIKILEIIENAHKNQINEFHYNYRVKGKNEEFIWVEDSINAEYDSLGNHFRSVIHTRNITERKQAELFINQRNNELKKLNADKDRFMSILAHDLTSPFNALLGLSELLAKNIRTYDIDKIENFVGNISKSAKNTFSLLEDLLMWTRSQSGNLRFEPQELNFTNICTEILEILNPIAKEKKITVNHFTAEGITLFADMDMLKTVLRNLISNAIKFTNLGGEIKIYAEQTEAVVTISVSDNGVGISPIIMDNLFDISIKTSTLGTADEKGTGLGLLLCKEFVEKHGGTIWAESEVGKGSEFKFTLPK